MTVVSMIYLAEHPDTVSDSLRAYEENQRQQLGSGAIAVEEKRLLTELELLEAEVAAIKKAMLATIRAGGNGEEFAVELTNAANRRVAIEKRLQELSPRPAAAQDSQPMDVAAKLAAVAQAIATVLTADAEILSPAKKQSVLAQIVESVTPTEEEARIRLRGETIHRIDMHCVTRWSRLGNVREGVSTREIVRHVTLKADVRFVLVDAYDKGFTHRGRDLDWATNLPLEHFLGEDCLFADKHDGVPISTEHGGPLRLIVPRLYAWKSAKWVKSVEFRADDTPGFWERGGYHMTGDPWREQRYRFGDEDEEAEDDAEEAGNTL